MASAVAKYAAKKMLRGEMAKYKDKAADDPYDPFYELIPDPKRPDKKKKVKKQIPAYIPSHDADILAKARKRAYMLDHCLFNFMGIRFGWSSVIGLVPAMGDGIGFLLAFLLIWRMGKVKGGLPWGTKLHMGFYMIWDFLIGLIPFVGDLMDASFKCNSRNVRLLEEHLDKVYKPQALVEADKKTEVRMKEVLGDDFRLTPATVYEDFSDEEEERRNTFNDRHDNVRQPTRAYSGRQQQRLQDEEMGLPRQDTRRSQKGPSRQQGTKSSRRH